MTLSATQDRIGSYRLLRKLAAGGGGTAYEAVRDERNHLHGTVVVKVLNAAPEYLGDTARTRRRQREYTARFKREAQLCLSFDHCGIPRVFEAGEANGVEYIVMERVDGITMTKFVNGLQRIDGYATESLVAYVATELASALAYAHDRKVVHRDISPSNVMFSRYGEVRLLDFGAAREAKSDLTRTGAFLGKYRYAAPETLRGVEATTQSDIYSLGVILLELASGRKVFDQHADALAASTERKLKSLDSRIEPLALSSGLKHILSNMLHFEAEDRYEHGRELYRKILPVLPAGVHSLEVMEWLGRIEEYELALDTQRTNSAPGPEPSPQTETVASESASNQHERTTYRAPEPEAEASTSLPITILDEYRSESHD